MLRFGWIVVLALLALPSVAQAGELSFAGYQWRVRDYGGGPGPNEWAPGNAYVDADGLHLWIAEVHGVWACSEVVLTQSLGFGTYTFEIAGRPDKMDRNVVLGLFNYPPSEEVGPDATNEIDIEFSQWGNADNPNRLNWTIYPPALGPKPPHKDRPFAIEGDLSTHSFAWSADGVSYVSQSGASSADWRFAPDDAASRVPQVPLPVHMNLWLIDGKPPVDGQPVEIVIKSFSYAPF